MRRVQPLANHFVNGGAVNCHAQRTSELRTAFHGSRVVRITDPWVVSICLQSFAREYLLTRNRIALLPEVAAHVDVQSLSFAERLVSCTVKAFDCLQHELRRQPGDVHLAVEERRDTSCRLRDRHHSHASDCRYLAVVLLDSLELYVVVRRALDHYERALADLLATSIRTQVVDRSL